MSEGIDYRRLSNRLLKGGISPRRVRRIVIELRDHFLDLKSGAIAGGMREAEAETWAASRLGTEQEVTDAMLAKPELQSWVTRWPWAIYMLMPTLLLDVLNLLVLGLVFGLVSALSGSAHSPDPWFASTIDGIMATVEYAAPLIVCAAFFWMAVKRRSKSPWLIPGIVLAGVLGGSFHMGVDWGQYPWELGLSHFVLPPHPYPLESITRIVVNVLLPLVPYLYWMRQQTLDRDLRPAG